MKKQLFLQPLLLLPICGLAASQAISATLSASMERTPFQMARLQSAYGKTPLQFEANYGQSDHQVKFLSRGNGYSLFLTPTQAVLSLSRPANSHQAKLANTILFASTGQAGIAKMESGTVRMQLAGANPNPVMSGLEELTGKVNYFIGNDPKKWRTNIATYKKVRYQGVYPGVDLVYYGSQRQLEYDFVVAPGADPKSIRLDFAGVKGVRVTREGDLALTLSGGVIHWRAPVIYQETGGARKAVRGHYVPHGGSGAGFEVAAYDHKRPLVIDPTLVYSTYLGGGGGGEAGKGIAVDGSGNAYVAGYTESASFPTQNPLQPYHHGGGDDVFITKFDASGTNLLYSTYLGGGGDDGALAIAVDSAGCAYVTGFTGSTDFPLQNPFQAAEGGGDTNAFVSKLSADGATLVYSTYLGGNGGSLRPGDQGNGIAVDGGGNAYVAGWTTSPNFPVHNPIQANLCGSYEDGFVSELNSTGTALIYSTYLGGTGQDHANAIAVDGAGNAYVTGFTTSADFPLQSPLQAAYRSQLGLRNSAFVSKINTGGTAFVYSTYLGGSGFEIGFGIAADNAGNAYVTGNTGSADFPLMNPIQSTLRGKGDAFVSKLNPAGSALVYSTYLGGTGFAEGSQAIALDSLGAAYVTGRTSSPDFPLQNPLQAINHGDFGPEGSDAFVAKLNIAGTALAYSTFLGGSSYDQGNAIAVDNNGNAYVAGETTSGDFPVRGRSHGRQSGSSLIAFVAKISLPGANDFNGDGWTDLLFQNTATNAIGIYDMNGSAVKGIQNVSPTPPADWRVVGDGNFNGGDTMPDLVMQNVTSNKIAIWYMNGGALITGGYIATIPAAGWEIAGIGDFTGNGESDLVLQNAVSGRIAIWHVKDSTVTGGEYVSVVASSGWRVVGTGDFNRDGKTDLALQNTVTGVVALWYMNGATVISGRYLPVSPPSVWAVAGVGDLNGDGSPDLVLQNSSTHAVALWYMNDSTLINGEYMSPQPAAEWRVAGPR